MNTRKFSKIQETTVAKTLGGKRQPNSGATTFLKGDVVLDDWLLECKTMTTSKSKFTLQRDWFAKNKREAIGINKRFNALAFNFGPKEPNYYIIDEPTFQLFLDLLKESEEDC